MGNVTPRRMLTADIELHANRTCRVGLLLDHDGTPAELVLALGWYSGRTWQEDRHEGITLPGDAIGRLRAALTEIEAGATPKAAK